MRPDVVGVAVAAEAVVGRDHVGLIAPDEPGEAARGLVEVGLPERPGIIVAGPAHHVRVAVAEVLPLGDPELVHRQLEFHGPEFAEPAVVVRGVERGDHDLALLAPGAGDEDDPMAVGDGLGDRAARADRLVVGVGVDGHQGQAVRLGRIGRIAAVPFLIRPAGVGSMGGVNRERVVGIVGHARIIAPLAAARNRRSARTPRPRGVWYFRGSHPSPADRYSRAAWTSRTGVNRTSGVQMIKSLGRRLHLQFGGQPRGDEPAPDVEPVAGAHPEVEFVAYGEDVLLSGRIRLNTDRLTDMLNAHDEFLLTDVLCERLVDGSAVELREILVQRDELLLVHATGPRGDQQRRQRTRPLPMALQSGPYALRGYLHTLPGTDPILHLRRRKTMVPLTEAWLEYESGTQRQRRRLSGVIVNRELIDWILPATDEEVEVPDMPVAKAGPLLKDFTGLLLG